jgi:hypothetical protein
MAEQPKRFVSKGKCNFCEKEIAKSGMKKHLAACEARKAANSKAAQDSKAKSKHIFHLLVDGGPYLSEFWMHLEMPAEAKLADLDQFLRATWLECCGHLSRFTINGREYQVHPKGMNVELSKVLSVGLQFDHEYDYGSTTELRLEVVGEREGISERNAVHVMARNNPPEYLCHACDKNVATQICTECLYEEEALFCDTCAKKHVKKVHEGYEEMFLPVVNSPRMGVCGYTGEDEGMRAEEYNDLP